MIRIKPKEKMMKKIGKTVSDADIQNFDVSEKVLNMGVDTAYKTKAGRKRHSIQMDRRLSIQMYADRRSSNASSTGESIDSLCKLNSTIRVNVLKSLMYCEEGGWLY